MYSCCCLPATISPSPNHGSVTKLSDHRILRRLGFLGAHGATDGNLSFILSCSACPSLHKFSCESVNCNGSSSPKSLLAALLPAINPLFSSLGFSTAKVPCIHPQLSSTAEIRKAIGGEGSQSHTWPEPFQDLAFYCNHTGRIWVVCTNGEESSWYGSVFYLSSLRAALRFGPSKVSNSSDFGQMSIYILNHHSTHGRASLTTFSHR